MKNLIKVLTALAAVVGAVYAVATYGEEIVAWAKRILSKLPKCPCCKECGVAEETEEAPAEEAPAEETPAAEEAPAAEEVPVEEAPAEVPASEPVAEDNDFAE